MRSNGGMPAQVDTRPFRKGENLAATPGAVVYRDDVCEVIQYTPSTPEVRARPVLMIPPQINRYYYAVDLGTITCDSYVTGAVTDHLTPWQGATAPRSCSAATAPSC